MSKDHGNRKGSKEEERNKGETWAEYPRMHAGLGLRPSRRGNERGAAFFSEPRPIWAPRNFQAGLWGILIAVDGFCVCVCVSVCEISPLAFDLIRGGAVKVMSSPASNCATFE